MEKKVDDVKSKASAVEECLVAASPYDEHKYAPKEKIRAVVVPNFPALGKAAAFRFLEWVQQNPTGVCSLPTGKTPEHFIKWVQKILSEWDSSIEIQREREKFGLHPSKPDLHGLTFVQMDEFYPISPQQENSFHHYVMEYYIKGFGLDPKKALLMDCSKIGFRDEGKNNDAGATTSSYSADRVGSCNNVFGPTGEPFDHINHERLEDVWPEGEVDLSLRMREPVNWLERVQQNVLYEVDQFCALYEERIRALGGIGFFMGGIGPDGHIAFNCQGCSHHTTTRLDQLNYKSQAAAAGDLGGIEAVKRRKVITIGLGTITYNPNCVAIICAAGEAKAKVVRDAIEESPHVSYPGTALHKLSRGCFFLTAGAAKLLSERKLVNLHNLSSIGDDVIERVLVDLSVLTRKKLLDLTEEDAKASRLVSYVLERTGKPIQELATTVRDSLIRKIERGCNVHRNKSFLHTEPHHDDIMLGYLPSVLRSTRSNEKHHFVCCTSGFNSVSNNHVMMMLDRVEKFVKSPTWKRLVAEGYFDVSSGDEEMLLDFRRRDVWKFLDGIATTDNELRDEGAARRFVANLCEIYGDVAELTPTKILLRIRLLRKYFENQYAGQKDDEMVQTLKGSCREFEAECVWGYIGWHINDISHLRLGFYTADIFTPEPTHQRDVIPILDLMQKVKPDIVSVALDPEASGPGKCQLTLLHRDHLAVIAELHGYWNV